MHIKSALLFTQSQIVSHGFRRCNNVVCYKFPLSCVHEFYLCVFQSISRTSDCVGGYSFIRLVPPNKLLVHCTSNSVWWNENSDTMNTFFRIVFSARFIIIRQSRRKGRREQHLPQARNAEGSINTMWNAGLHLLSPAPCLQEAALLYCQAETSIRNFTSGVVSGSCYGVICCTTLSALVTDKFWNRNG